MEQAPYEFFYLFHGPPSRICLAPFDDIAEKKAHGIIGHGLRKISLASATRLSRKFRDPCLHAVVQLAYRHAHMLIAFRHAGVAFRPTITRGLALSANFYKYNSSIIFSSNFNAKTG